MSFIDQMTRKLLVQWADHEVVCSEAPIRVVSSIAGQRRAVVYSAPNVYVEHALSKGWITKRAPHRLTAKGFTAAASFLKR